MQTRRTSAAAHRSQLDETRAFFRLYMIPGMAHCGGGPGLNEVEALVPLEQWVERGVAPESLKVWRNDHGATRTTRPVCAYPDVVHYDGKGDPGDLSSFACAPESAGTESPGRSR